MSGWKWVRGGDNKVGTEGGETDRMRRVEAEKAGLEVTTPGGLEGNSRSLVL